MPYTLYPEADKIQELIAAAQTIVIIQADNPDGDSLASSLALETILGDMGKDPVTYCAVHVPDYLHFLEGWDRVTDELPKQFDLSIIVDTSAESLLQTTLDHGNRPQLASKPCIIIDHHHEVQPTISFASLVCVQPAVATGQLLYELAGQLDWPIAQTAASMIVSSIMADSLGLTTEATTARTIHIVAELVDKGVSIAALEAKRRLMMRKSAEITAYKARLLSRIEYGGQDRIATITIPWSEIEKYSHAYNPSMLVMEDMRLVDTVMIAISFKIYKDNKITAKIRCNYGAPIAGDLAIHFGGGGHAYASGFKISNGREFDEVKNDCLRYASELLDALPKKA